MIPFFELAVRLFGNEEPHRGWSDRRLIAACVVGEEAAWAALVEKYQTLVYSFARELGASPEAASDLFHAVWVHIYSELPELKRRDSIRDRLIELLRRKYGHWQSSHPESSPLGGGDSVSSGGNSRLRRLLRDQFVREAIHDLPPNCRELIRLLFYSDPPLPSTEVADALGMTPAVFEINSGRCLKRLHKEMESQPT